MIKEVFPVVSRNAVTVDIQEIKKVGGYNVIDLNAEKVENKDKTASDI